MQAQTAPKTPAEIVAGYVRRFGNLTDAISAAGVYYDRERLDALLAEKSRLAKVEAQASQVAA